MGKGKQKFNKKQAVRFTLVPGFDQNGKPVTHFRPVQTKKSKVSARQRERLIKQISDQTYDEIQINGKLVGQDEIPAFVLEQIKGRKDLVFNQKQMSQSQGQKQNEGDLYEVVDAAHYDDDFGKEQKQWIDEEEIIDEDDDEYEEYEEYDDEDMEQGEEWEDEDVMEEDIEEQNDNKNKKPFKLNQEEFPVLNKVNIEGKEYELTEAQIKLLDVLLPENYQNFEIDGIKFEKYDEYGLPLSQKAKYEQFIATGNEGVVDSFDYVPEKPTPIFDTDLKPSQMTGELRQIDDALNFDGEQGVYQQLEDDFFSNLIKSEIQTNRKQKKQKKQKSKKTVPKTIKPLPQEVQKVKLPKQLQKTAENKQQNIFSKYDQLDEDILQEEITDDMIQKALDDFQHNLEPKQGVKGIKSKIEDDEEEMEERNSGNNMSMNFSQIQKCQEFFGKDGQLDWRCLTRKQKKEYMKTKIIRDFYDQVREREIQQKLKGKKNVSSEQLHLKNLIKRLPYQEDHVMRRTLQEDAKQEVDLEEDSSYQSQSQEEDIIEYHQRTSVISSNLNEISQPSKRKHKKKQQDDEERLKQLDELSQTLTKLKQAAQKRNRNETKQERKERKEKQKQLKKQKKEVKKQFSQKFEEERKKHIKMTKPSDPLHKVAFVKII